MLIRIHDKASFPSQSPDLSPMEDLWDVLEAGLSFTDRVCMDINLILLQIIETMPQRITDK